MITMVSLGMSVYQHQYWVRDIMLLQQVQYWYFITYTYILYLYLYTIMIRQGNGNGMILTNNIYCFLWLG
jgi:hypothetical protein